MSLVARKLTVEKSGRALLRDVDIEVAPGRLLAVVGPNGAGKSTLVAALAGEAQSAAGQVMMNDQLLDSIALAEQSRLRAVVSAPPQLAFDYTVRDVIALGWVHGERFGPQACERALQQLMAECELEALADRVFMTLSSGEKQRAQFARACLQLWRPAQDSSPRVLLLDEPTANLDVSHALLLLEALQRRARQGDAVLVVLHDLNLAARFAHHVLLLANGATVAQGPPAAVMTSDSLSKVYGTPVHVEHHSKLNRLVVIT